MPLPIPPLPDEFAEWADLPPAVCVVIRAPHLPDHVLMTVRARQDIAHGYWLPITGRRDPGDASLDETCIRECQEELGLDVIPRAIAWLCPTDHRAFLLHWFIVDIAGPTDPAGAPIVTPDPSEVGEVRWLPLDDVAALSPMFPDTRRFFESFRPAVRNA